MPKYYCDYCDTYLTHDSPSVRRTHNQGRNHKENVRMYYQQWMEEQAQKLIDQTTAAFKSGKFSSPAAQAVAMAAMHGAQTTLNYRAASTAPTAIVIPPNGLIPRMPVPQGAYFYPAQRLPASMGQPRYGVHPGAPYPVRTPDMMRPPPIRQITLPHHQMVPQMQPHGPLPPQYSGR